MAGDSSEANVRTIPNSVTVLWAVIATGASLLGDWLSISPSPALPVLALLAVLLCQVMVLRRYVPRAVWWLLAAPLALVVGAMVGGLTGGWVQDLGDGVEFSRPGLAPITEGRSLAVLVASALVAGAIMGLFLGAITWLVLRRGAGAPAIWIVSNILAAGGAFGISWLGGPAGSVVSALWFGIVQALGLVACLRRGGQTSPPNVAAAAGAKKGIWRRAPGLVLAAIVVVPLTVWFVIGQLTSGLPEMKCQGSDALEIVAGCSAMIDAPMNASGAPLPQHLAEIHVNRGVGYEMLGRFEKSLADLETAIRLDPALPRAHAEKAVTLWRMERYSEAIMALDKAIELRPDYTFALARRGDFHFRQGSYQMALADITEYLKLRPWEVDALHMRGMAWLGLNEEEKAVADFREVMRIDADYGPTRKQLEGMGLTP